MTDTVAMNDFQRMWRDTDQAVLQAVHDVGESGWYVLGKQVSAFESALAKASDRKAVIGCANGLDAIEISLRALGMKPGDKVLTTPLSAFPTTLAILRAGGVPVFIDVDESGLVRLDLAEQAFAADPALRFFVPVHLYGHCLDLDKLDALRKKFSVRIVEDAAQAIGARFRGRSVGSASELTATSFYPTKNLGALGDGGAVMTDDAQLEKTCRALRDYGQSSKYVHDMLGLNSRLDELHAAILHHAFLPKLEKWTERRRQIAATYLRELTNPLVKPVTVPEGSESVWHLFPTRVPADRRDALMKYLREQHIQSGIHYPMLISDQKALSNVPVEVRGGLDQAKDFAATELSLPIHPYLEDSEVARVISAVNAWQVS